MTRSQAVLVPERALSAFVAPLFVIALAGCAPVDLQWELALGSGVDAESIARIEVEVHRGECTSKGGSHFRTTILPAGEAQAPPVLDDGQYCLSARAVDSSCGQTAFGETTVDLPLDAAVARVTLNPAAMPCSGECRSDGSCGQTPTGNVRLEESCPNPNCGNDSGALELGPYQLAGICVSRSPATCVTVTEAAGSFSGGADFSGGTLTRSEQLDLVITASPTAVCGSLSCSEVEIALRSALLGSVSCSGTGSCRCELSLPLPNTSYTITGNELELDDGNDYEFCAAPESLLFQAVPNADIIFEYTR